MEQEAREELFQIFDRIAELDKEKFHIHREMQDIWAVERVISDRYYLEIGAVDDAKGRRLYSTDKLRDAALRLKLNEDEEYRELNQAVRALRRKEDELLVEHTRVSSRKTVLMTAIGAEKVPLGLLLLTGVKFANDYVKKSPYQDREIELTNFVWGFLEINAGLWWAQILLALQQHFACDLSRALKVWGRDNKPIANIKEVYPQELKSPGWHIETFHYPTGLNGEDEGTVIKYPDEIDALEELHIIIEAYVVEDARSKSYWHVDVLIVAD